MEVGDALRKRGIRAVLTGGACASLYTKGLKTSHDADFVLTTETDVLALEAAMLSVGFKRRRDHYVHATARFIVEFPSGPLGSGRDDKIRPVTRKRKALSALALSATDSCRDRLAGYFHWNDLQGLRAAVQIAAMNTVNMGRIKAWSREEGAAEKFDVFRQTVRTARKQK